MSYAGRIITWGDPDGRVNRQSSPELGEGFFWEAVKSRQKPSSRFHSLELQAQFVDSAPILSLGIPA
jgi:hypothetical protein